MTVTAKIKLDFTGSDAGSNEYGGPYWNGALSYLQSFTNGTGANQADIVYFDERTVASATNDDLDLAGVLSTALGSTITAAELVAIAVVNGPVDTTAAANTTDLTIGGASADVTGFLGGTTPTIGPIKPGGVFLIAAGDAAGIGAVTATTADILRIANSSGASAKYQVAILARSA